MTLIDYQQLSQASPTGAVFRHSTSSLGGPEMTWAYGKRPKLIAAAGHTADGTAKKRMRNELTRRRFLGTLATAAASSRLGLPSACGSQNGPRTKTILSFYCDDTSPYAAGAEAFGTFLDFCTEQHIAGEASCILGMSGHSMVRNPNEVSGIPTGRGSTQPRVLAGGPSRWSWNGFASIWVTRWSGCVPATSLIAFSRAVAGISSRTCSCAGSCCLAQYASL
jgi:hypothetical protein